MTCNQRSCFLCIYNHFIEFLIHLYDFTGVNVCFYFLILTFFQTFFIFVLIFFNGKSFFHKVCGFDWYFHKEYSSMHLFEECPSIFLSFILSFFLSLTLSLTLSSSVRWVETRTKRRDLKLAIYVDQQPVFCKWYFSITFVHREPCCKYWKVLVTPHSEIENSDNFKIGHK